MKNIYIVLSVILFFTMLLFPITCINKGTEAEGETVQTAASAETVANEESFLILISEEEKIKEIPCDEYVFGVVAAEMPASYEPEALKAQAVAAYTYAVYKKNEAEISGRDYHLSDSGNDSQCYISKKQAREKWGDNADQNESKVMEAVQSVLGQTILYEGEPILAAYHAVSSGKTENASDIWGGDYPYLKSVDSVNDLLNPDYLSTVTLSSAEVSEKFKSADITASGDAAAWFGGLDKTENGAVKNVTICEKSVSGEDMRQALGLRSNNFEVSLEGDKFTFTVKGYGHGVGLSQYGANRMALQGSTYTEILAAYYTGCKLGEIAEN